MAEYERRRFENIKRNGEMLAALNIYSKLNDLTAISLRTCKRSYVKKPKTENHVVKRQSLRTRGVPPDASTAGGITKPPKLNSISAPLKSPWELGPLAMRDMYIGDDKLDQKQLSEIIWGCSENHVVKRRRSLRTRGVPPDASTAGGITKPPKLNSISAPLKSPWELGPLAVRDMYIGDDKLDQKQLSEIIWGCSGKFISDEANAHPCEQFEPAFKPMKKLQGSVDVEALQLKPENVARVVQDRVTSLMFFPTLDMQMVVVGNRLGDIGFWNVNGKQEDGSGIYLYHPHPAQVSGFVIHPFSISKMYSSCYDGFIRLMDVEIEVFDMVYRSEYKIHSISQGPHDVKSLYFSEGWGIKMWDVRAGKSSFSCRLHKRRINSIDFHSDNENMMATSSSDATACIWDLRQISADKPAPLKTVTHNTSVTSAYFSPSGKCLATTSCDNKAGFSRGANYEDTSMVYHKLSPHLKRLNKGIWGWDDSSIYASSMKGGVDVISVEEKRIVATLESDLVSAPPYRFAAHPYNIGMLAGATSGGQVYIWTLS